MEENNVISVEEVTRETHIAKIEVTDLLLQRKIQEATEYLVKFILDSIGQHIYTTRNDIQSEMWIYKEGIYVPEGKTYAKEIIRAVTGKAYTPHFANTVIAKIEVDTYINADDFFLEESPDEIAVKNGILQLQTKTLLPFTPEKRFFTKIPVKYDSSKNCPNIITFFKLVLRNEDDVRRMLELFGYCLLREYPIEKAVMLTGVGRNGKTKTMELLKLFIGVENCSGESLEAIEKDNWALGSLHRKLVNIHGDLNPSLIRSAGNFKSLTGGDLISAPRKFLNPVKYKNYAKLIFAANKLPPPLESTDAFWSRWLLFEFPNQFLTADEYNKLSLEEKNLGTSDGGKYAVQTPGIISLIATEDELSGLLNLAVEGLNCLLSRKGFSDSLSMKALEKMWLRKSDSFRAFLEDCIAESCEGHMAKSSLKKMYADYCKRHNLKIVGDKVLRHDLSERYGSEEEVKRIGEEVCRVWTGIRAKSFIEFSYKDN